MTNKLFKKLNSVRNGIAPKQKKICIAATATATFALSLTVTFTSLAAPVYQVEIAGEDTAAELKTFASDPHEILSNAGFTVDSDYVLDVTDPANGESGVITVYKSGVTELTVDGEKEYVFTSGTVEDMLSKNGIDICSDDYVSCALDDITFDGMKVEVIHAFEVTVNADDATETCVTTGGKVGEALSEAGVVLGKEDELENCSLDDVLYDGMVINVLRCTYEERTAVEEFDCGTVEKEDSSMYIGQTKMVSNGKSGVAARIYNDKYIGGKLVSSEIVRETVIKDAVDAVKSVGTKELAVGKTGAISNLVHPASLDLDKNGLPKNYSSYIDGVATAYYGGGITASGIPASEGYIAVDPKVIPYGTELYVVSLDGQYVYGYCIAADTGGFVKGGWADADLYMDSKADCVNFGIRGVRIYIL